MLVERWADRFPPQSLWPSRRDNKVAFFSLLSWPTEAALWSSRTKAHHDESRKRNGQLYLLVTNGDDFRLRNVSVH
jgi:hypothetical protein